MRSAKILFSVNINVPCGCILQVCSLAPDGKSHLRSFTEKCPEHNKKIKSVSVGEPHLSAVLESAKLLLTTLTMNTDDKTKKEKK